MCLSLRSLALSPLNLIALQQQVGLKRDLLREHTHMLRIHKAAWLAEMLLRGGAQFVGLSMFEALYNFQRITLAVS